MNPGAGNPILPATLWIGAVILAAAYLGTPASLGGWAALATCAVLPPLLIARRRGRAASARHARLMQLAKDEPRIETLAPTDGPPLQQLRDRLTAARREGRQDEVERTELLINARQSGNDYR